MTTWVQEDISETTPLPPVKDGEGEEELDGGYVRVSGREPFCFFREDRHLLRILKPLFEQQDLSWLPVCERDLICQTRRVEKDPEETIQIQKAFHAVCGGNVACKVFEDEYAYEIYVPDIGTARRIVRELEEIFREDEPDEDDDTSISIWYLFGQVLEIRSVRWAFIGVLIVILLVVLHFSPLQ